MIVTLKDSHKAHLSFLFSQNISVLQDFCKLAIEYLSKGPNIKLYQSAGQKLSVEPGIVQNAVEGLVNLLISCCRHKLSGLDLRDTILTVGFNEDQFEILQSLYNSREKELSQVLEGQNVDLLQFKDLEWRLEAQVSSRSMLEQMSPQVLMRLSLENSGGPQHFLMQADPANLVHMTEVLDAALQEANSQHFRRIQRRFK